MCRKTGPLKNKGDFLLTTTACLDTFCVANMKNTPDVLVTTRKAIFLFHEHFCWAVSLNKKCTFFFFKCWFDFSRWNSNRSLIIQDTLSQFVISMSHIKIVNGLSQSCSVLITYSILGQSDFTGCFHLNYINFVRMIFLGCVSTL